MTENPLDPRVAAPYTLGVTLLHDLLRLPDFEWLQDGDVLTRLIGTPAVLENLQAGRTVEEILAADSTEHEAWREARKSALLY